MKIGIIIPDRNDRPRFLENCLRMIKNQTLQPEIIELVNDKPLTFNSEGQLEPAPKRDITWRYRIGYDRLRDKNLDVIAFIENDDWYAPNYLETMSAEWEKQGRPNLLGTDYTIYYHIKLFAHVNMLHPRRCSQMCTLIKPDMNFKWCNDVEPFTDMWLWSTLENRVIFHPTKHICMGIKHGEGLTGGRYHVDKLHRYVNKDFDKAFLKSVLDEQSFNFYSNYYGKLPG